VGAAPRPALSARRGVVALLLLAPLLLAADPGGRPAPVSVYGVELDARGDRERVLVFGAAPIEGRLEERDAKTLLVVIPGAVLDASAPARVTGAPGAAVRVVTIEEVAGEGGPELRLVIERVPGLPAELSSRGATLAVELSRPAPVVERGIAMQFANTELAEIVEKVARATGQRFIYDDSLRGRITITSPERVSREEAIELLHTALLQAGFVALPTPSGARKILPLAAGVGEAPFTADAPRATSEAQTATLVRLRSATALRVQVALQPWLGATALAIAHVPTNALILAGSEARLRQLMTLVAEIDHVSNAELVVRRLRYRSAEDAAALLLAALGEKVGARAGVEAWPDARTGALVLRAPPEEMADARALLAEIDRPEHGNGRIGVHELRYADPESMAAILQSLATGDTSSTLPGGAAAPSLVGGLSLAGRDFGVAVFAPTRALVLRGDPETLRILDDLIDELDRPPPTIEVEVLVLQLINDDSLDLGFDAFIPLTTPKNPNDWIANTFLNPSGGGLLEPGTGTGPAYAARFTRAPLVLPFIDAEGNPTSLIVPKETFVVTANDARVRSQILMRPHLTMLAGEEQEIFAGNNIPVSVSSAAAAPAATDTSGATSATSALQTSQTIERQDVGITVRVKPTLGEAGGVRLELDVNVSSLAPPLAGDVEEVGPTLRNRQLNSTVHLNDDEFIVVGFAREMASQQDVIGTPWLMKVPILGWAFKKAGDTRVTARFVIAVQAHIQRTPDERIADTIRHRIAFQRSNARLAPLATGSTSVWVLRVATRSDEAEAQAIATRLSSGARPASVSRWESAGGPIFDVNLFGFATVADANQAALKLRDEGYDPEVLVAPLEAD
jgi:general secretion pathway protein D